MCSKACSSFINIFYVWEMAYACSFECTSFKHLSEGHVLNHCSFLSTAIDQSWLQAPLLLWHLTCKLVKY